MTLADVKDFYKKLFAVPDDSKNSCKVTKTMYDLWKKTTGRIAKLHNVEQNKVKDMFGFAIFLQ